MKTRHILIIALVIILFKGCGENSPVTPIQPPAENYQKIITAENGNIKFELWTTDNDTLMTGYNKVGFKVFENGTPKTSGNVKFFARMYHFNSERFHSTPVEPVYNYDAGSQMYKGYIIMLMPSDTTSRWYGFFNYNDELRIDSVNFDVGWDVLNRFKIFTHLPTSLSYLITVVTPKSPVKGVNDFWCLLHESPDFIDFTQVNTAEMYLRPTLDSLNHISQENVNPVYSGEGLYKGKVNLDYSGGWKVYDSIYYNNKWITENGTPYIYFSVP